MLSDPRDVRDVRILPTNDVGFAACGDICNFDERAVQVDVVGGNGFVKVRVREKLGKSVRDPADAGYELRVAKRKP